LFVSLNGELENATLFGQAKNYEYQKSGPDYEVIVWKKAEDGTDNITNVPITQVNETYSHLPTFKDVGYPSDPLKFFVERPKNEAKTATCFQSVKKFFTGSGTKRRRKNKRKSSNKKMKQRKSSNKRRRTKKNKILPIMYGGASIKQYGIASALRSLIFTYFPQRGFDIINLPEDDSLNKYGLTNKYTTVMDLLNQIVHNDDGRSTLPREKNFGDFLKYSQDLDSILTVIISDIKNYLREQIRLNKINSNSNAIILNLITNIENDLPKEAKKEELPASASASAQGVVPGRTRISVTSIFSKVSPDDRQSKYPLMCQYLRIEFPSNTNRASSIAFNFFENAPMSKEDLAEILDLFKQYIKFGYIGPEYDGEIKKLQEEVEKK
jgi:hypothetical protein